MNDDDNIVRLPPRVVIVNPDAPMTEAEVDMVKQMAELEAWYLDRIGALETQHAWHMFILAVVVVAEMVALLLCI